MEDKITLEAELIKIKGLLSCGLVAQDQGYSDSAVCFEAALSEVITLISECK